MYLETMERVLGGTDKIILDSKGGQGVVPYLPLDQLQKRKEGAQLMLQSALCGRRGRRSAPSAAAAYFALFIVHQNEQAIVLEFGKPVRIITRAGPVLEDAGRADGRLSSTSASSISTPPRRR